MVMVVERVRIQQYGLTAGRTVFHVPPAEIQREISRRLVAAGQDPGSPVIAEQSKRLLARASLIMLSTWGEYISPTDAEAFVGEIFEEC